MKDFRLLRSKALRLFLMVVLLGMVGVTKSYAYDFYATCPSGQILWFNIIDYQNHYVEITYPGWDYNTNNVDWNSYEKPKGFITLPETIEKNGVTYTVTKIGTFSFISCYGLLGDLVIPSTVTSIGEYAFTGCSGFDGTLTIPSSVTKIDHAAFSGCSGLTGTVVIPESVTNLGYEAFSSCAGITGVVLPNSINSIGYGTFYNCTSLASFNLPESLTEIGGRAFFRCMGLTGQLVIPNSVTTIGTEAFYYCNGFTGPLVLGNSLTDLGEFAFSDCPGFTSLILPNTLQTINRCAFVRCSGLQGELVIPNSVTFLGYAAFNYCDFTEVTIPSSIATMYEAVFAFNTNLATVNYNATNAEMLTYNSNVNTYWGMFKGCTSLSTINIGANVTSIPPRVFRGDYELNAINTYAIVPPTAVQYSFSGIPSDVAIHVPSCSLNEYQTAAYWSQFTNWQDDLPCCPIPYNLEINNITHTTADLTWTGFSDSYTVQKRSAESVNYSFFDGFEDGLDAQGWTTIRNGGGTTSTDWHHFDATTFTSGTVTNHNGSYVAMSRSWSNSAYSVDNWLITPQVSLQGTLKFWVRDDGEYHEHYDVYVSTTGNSITDFGSVPFFEPGDASDEWTEVSVDLSSFAGVNGYIAIRHTDVDQDFLLIDDFGIAANSVPAGEWINVTTTATDGAYTITGLTANTMYEVKVKGNCGDEYSDVVTFTTIDDNTRIFNTAGNWNVAGNWIGGIPTIANNVIIRKNVIIPANCDASAKTITLEGSPTPTITIKDGGQMHTNTNGVTATFEKEIKGYTGTNDHYYLISVPNNYYYHVAATAVTGMINGNYDLYHFDATQEGEEWRNYEAGSFNLWIGRGYLYANAVNETLQYTGKMCNQLTEGNYDYLNIGTTSNDYSELNYNTETHYGKFNLIGNSLPYNAFIYVGTESGGVFTPVQTYYYKMNENGDELEVSNNAVKPWEGVFVQATAANQIAIISSDNLGDPSLAKSLNLSVSSSNSVSDVAILNFNKGEGLEKFQLNPDHTKVYIPQDGKDYAVVTAEAQGEMPVNFKASENGAYTIGFSSENVEFGYLHLIDNMTGADVDLLQTPSYSFDAKVTDYTSRFRLVFSANDETGNESEDNFAFISNGQLIVTGEGTLQVVDVMGRVLVNKQLSTTNSQLPTANFKAGVYMLRLIQGNDVKTQKIVVR